MTMIPPPPLLDRQALTLSCYNLACKLAHEAARRFPYLDRDDLKGAALLALSDAGQRFEPARGLKFTTLVHTCVTRALDREVDRQIWARRYVSLDVPVGDPEDDITHADFVPARPERPETLPPDLVAGLDERTRKMLKGRFEEDKTFEELGREHGVSKERARQIIAEAGERLRATKLATSDTGG